MAMRGVSILAVLVGLGTAFGVAPNAAAQGPEEGDGDYFRRDRNTSVAQRRKERDDEGGWRAGSFRVKPQLDIGVGYTDNYAAAETNPEESTIYEIAGRLDIASDWGRHALNASLYSPTTVYDAAYTTTDYVATVSGRIDVDRSLSIDGGVGYGDRAEPLGFSDPAITLRRPLRYDDVNAYVGFAKTFNRLRIAGRAQYQDLDFRRARLINGTPIEFNERDVSVLTYGLRADYAVTDATAFFVSASANQRDHDLDPPAVPVNQDSEGQEYLVGVNFDLTNLMRGEIAVGQLNQSYDEPGVDDQSGLAARGQIEWFPDELMTVTLGVERAIQNSRTADAATYVGTDVNLSVDYEYRRNINIGVSAGYSDEEYEEVDRDDTRWSIYATAEYEVNRTMAVTFSAGHIEQSSDGVDAGRNYDANVGLIGIRLRR